MEKWQGQAEWLAIIAQTGVGGVAAVLSFKKHNGWYTLLNKQHYDPAIDHTHFSRFFAVMSVRGVVALISKYLRLKRKFVDERSLRFVDIFLNAASGVVLCMALGHEASILKRSRNNNKTQDLLAQRETKHDTPSEKIKNFFKSLTFLFYTVASLGITISILSYLRPKSQEWRDLELAYSFVDKVPAVLLAAVAFNEKRRNIGLKTKTSLFLVLLLSFLGDFTSMLFPPGKSEMAHHGLKAACVPFLYLFVHSEFKRNLEEVIWRSIKRDT